ncbi:hypothetical protein DFS34DRAFT_101425 [Phlyctochytrium arcticum]|nr:hypothetical protein DFS34DRAFT_101425 [Phlyctochytrium arcticum]
MLPRVRFRSLAAAAAVGRCVFTPCVKRTIQAPVSRSLSSLQHPKLLFSIPSSPSALLLRPSYTIRCESSWGRTKVASKRLTKKYKLKNHGGAVARWMVLGGGTFKRGQAGRGHLNRKVRVRTRKMKRRRVIANPQQRKLLKKLMPYWKKKYFR